MRYKNIVKGIFLERPNRFIAIVDINGTNHRVHVKNTGRCKEILKPGTIVYLELSANPNRKTAFSLISALRDGVLINIDSQVPNKVVYEALLSGSIPDIGEPYILQKEKTFHDSRFDLYFEDGARRGFIEVKGVTLEENGIARFPDAPTKRGRKHLMEMIDAVRDGYAGYVIFLIQMKGASIFKPNDRTDPAFSSALRLAEKNGVGILAYDSIVTIDSIILSRRIPLCLE